MRDSYNIRAEYGPADFDRTHLLTLNYSWDLPFFKNANAIMRGFLGGWRVSGITEFQSGAPLTVNLPNDEAGVGSYNQRPNQIANPFQPGPVAANPGCIAPSQVHNAANWFDPCAFALNPAGTFGDEGIGAIRGPHFQNWDMGLSKNFAVRESVGLELELQAFNAFDHPSLGQPNLTWTNGSPLGTITSATSPRIVQLSLALKF